MSRLHQKSDVDYFLELPRSEQKRFSYELEKAYREIDSLPEDKFKKRCLDKWRTSEALATAIGRMVFGTKRKKWFEKTDKRTTHSMWRNAVLEKDNFTCAECGFGDNEICNQLEAHHIYPVSKYPELSKDIGNGITLCVRCHRSIRGREMELIDYFLSKSNSVPITEADLEDINWMII